MTFEEAKKILKKEGYDVEKVDRTCSPSIVFTEYESPEICEAMQVVCSAGYGISMPLSCFNERKARLKLEFAENTKAPGPGEEQPKEGNPALKESASQFNDALLDEQAKKIAELTKEKSNLEYQITILNACKEHNENVYRKHIKRLGKEIARLNGIIHDKNEEIKRKTKGCCELVAENVDLKEGLRKTESLLHDTREANSRNLDTCFKNEDLINELKEKLAEKTKLAKKYAKELSDSSLDLCKLEKKLKKQLKDKNAVLSDVAEELRLSKIREKNLVEVSQKYMKENEELREKVAEKTKLVEMVRKGSKEYCDYGIAAEKMIQKLAKIIVGRGFVTSKDFEKCRHWAKGYRFNPQLPELSEEEEEKLKYRVSYDKAKEGGDQSATIVLCDNGITLSKEEAEIIERCTKNGTELHYSEKDGLTYTNMCGEEMPIICLRLMFHIYTDEEIKNMKK